jgi:phosphoribosylanthranilate isomerase
MATHSIVVQIYEIQNPAEADAMIALGVDRIGSVVLSEKNWKIPAIREAIQVSKDAGVKHSLIPLFDTEKALFQCIDYYAPDVVHFCESFADQISLRRSCEALTGLHISVRKRFPEMEIMRTIPVGATGSSQSIPTFEVAKCFQTTSDYFLVDTSLGSEPVHGFVGITGHTCDWTVARELTLKSTVPLFLAGGLSPENVYAAIMQVRPFGVDSCTRTNAVDGDGRPIRFRKDPSAVKAFIEAVRQAENDLSSEQNEIESPGGRKRL